ncbi:hypothetical protein T492DRAFT_369970 [Pavlovales sp. CCMP2436]|nr:hypothetical protein T492DRAFT_369970 [Pavlovales sp. CCMP2436]
MLMRLLLAASVAAHARGAAGGPFVRASSFVRAAARPVTPSFARAAAGGGGGTASEPTLARAARRAAAAVAKRDAPAPPVVAPAAPARSASGAGLSGGGGKSSGPPERYKAVTLIRGKARLFKDGSPLVYGGALHPPAEALRPAELVRVVDGVGVTVGWGPYNENSMFRVRILRHASEQVARANANAPKPARDASGALLESKMPTNPAYELVPLLRERLSAALSLRRRGLGLPNAATTAYRWVNGEGDKLSGLVIDILGPAVIISSSALWCEVHRDAIEKAVMELSQTAVTPLAMGAELFQTTVTPGGAVSAGPVAAFVLWRRSEARLKQDGWAPAGSADIRAADTGNSAEDSDDDTDEEEEAVEVGEEEDGGESGSVAAEMSGGKESASEDAAVLAAALAHGVDLRAVTVRESGIAYECNAFSGQKTGFYCDQR